MIVAAFDRIARNVRHFLEVLDELSHLNIEFISLRENIDTSGPLGRATVVKRFADGRLTCIMRGALIAEVRAYFLYEDATDTQPTGFPYSERHYLEATR